MPKVADSLIGAIEQLRRPNIAELGGMVVASVAGTALITTGILDRSPEMTALGAIVLVDLEEYGRIMLHDQRSSDSNA